MEREAKKTIPNCKECLTNDDCPYGAWHTYGYCGADHIKGGGDFCGLYNILGVTKRGVNVKCDRCGHKIHMPFETIELGG